MWASDVTRVLFLQQPIAEQATSVAVIVSNPAQVNAETFTVAAEIIANLLSSAISNQNVRLYIYRVLGVL